MELLHFLKSVYNETWEWSAQYEADEKYDESDDDDERDPGACNLLMCLNSGVAYFFFIFWPSIECARQGLDEDGYYCNQELLQLLVFDAKVTNASYGTWSFETESDKNLAAIYNANLRFVATMSGLTRWQFICGEIEVEDDK